MNFLMCGGKLCLNGMICFFLHLATDQYLPSDSFFLFFLSVCFQRIKQTKSSVQNYEKNLGDNANPPFFFFLNKKCNVYLFSRNGKYSETPKSSIILLRDTYCCYSGDRPFGVFFFCRCFSPPDQGDSVW